VAYVIAQVMSYVTTHVVACVVAYVMTYGEPHVVMRLQDNSRSETVRKLRGICAVRQTFWSRLRQILRVGLLLQRPQKRRRLTQHDARRQSVYPQRV